MASINVDSKPGGHSAVTPGAGGAAGGSADVNNPANAKEKTPMCLINELSRFNKLKHQYTLVDEQGPAHKKTFFVQLKLGDEEYSANEGSIKRAQHLAAQQALAKTKYQQPPPKMPKDELGPYDVEADKIIRLKPSPAPNPPGTKKQKRAQQQELNQRPENQVPKTPPVTVKRENDGIVSLKTLKPKSFVQKSVEKARNFMQNRTQPSSFGARPSGFAFGGGAPPPPPFKRPRMDMEPTGGFGMPTPPTLNSTMNVTSSVVTTQLSRERLDIEYKKLELQKQMVDIEKQRLDMEAAKFDYEIRLLQFQLKEYERASAGTGTETLADGMAAIRRLGSTDTLNRSGSGANDSASFGDRFGATSRGSGGYNDRGGMNYDDSRFGNGGGGGMGGFGSNSMSYGHGGF